MGKYTHVERALIEEVRKYTSIWQTSDPDYKNKIIKENAWKAAAEAVNLVSDKTYSVNDFKEKNWKNIRDTYVRALNGNWKMSGSGTVELPKFPYFEVMSFIKPFVNIRSGNASSNCSSLDSSTSNSNDRNTSIDDYDDDKDPESALTQPQDLQNDTFNDGFASDQSSTSNISTPDVGRQAGRKRPHNRMSNQAINRALDVKVLHYMTNTSQNQLQKANIPSHDADHNFGLSVAAQIRQMDRRQNALAKAKIQQILLEIQYPECSEPSVTTMSIDKSHFACNSSNVNMPMAKQTRFYVPNRSDSMDMSTPYTTQANESSFFSG
ncbi:transcription factor Adf-1-like [Paramuricea clavata]|uniref:Transcription factor Adf-1-like n=1 Tax=Paramuricea clavata TaxID=317549 RepID=A0A7D9ERA7_PARCT|nr:transcription factor Adf-1-like [Paramuricea clavata]